jgi:predicted enzyme related to lactoylglutathione lyase
VTVPVSYVELNSPDLEASARFFEAVFDWEFQPFASQDYLVAPRGHAAGIDTGLMPSQDGAPRAIPILRVDSIDAVREALEAAGGTIVVEPFEFPGVGRGCYATDPAGVLFGLHEYE